MTPGRARSTPSTWDGSGAVPADARVRRDSLPFHPEHAELLGSSETLAYLIRSYSVWEMTCGALGHPGGSFSEAEFLAVLFNYVLRFDAADPAWPMRDVFYLSKAHACPAVYTALAMHGYFPIERLKYYGTLGVGPRVPPRLHGHARDRGQRWVARPDPRRGRRAGPGAAVQRPRPQRPDGLRAAR